MTVNTPDHDLQSALDPAACTCANLRKASRMVTQAYDHALHPVGLKATQFTLMATLERGGTLPLTRLANALVMDRTTLTRNLKPLVGKGLVRVDQVEDQRVRNISLTDTGREILARAKPLWQIAQSQLIKALGHKRWAGFIEDLSRTVSVVQNQ